MAGVMEGGHGYLVAAYVLTWTVAAGYGLSLFARWKK